MAPINATKLNYYHYKQAKINREQCNVQEAAITFYNYQFKLFKKVINSTKTYQNRASENEINLQNATEF